MQICPGGLSGSFLSVGDTAKFWDVIKAMKCFHATHQPHATPSQPLSHQLSNIQNPKPHFPEGEAGRIIRPLLLTSCPLTSNHSHP